MRRSLFGRLAGAIALSMTGVWLVATGVGYWLVRTEAREVHDRQLVQAAQVLLALAGQEILEYTKEARRPTRRETTPDDRRAGLASFAEHLSRYAPPGGLAFRIEAARVGFRFRSANFPAALSERIRTAGFGTVALDGARWRTYSRPDDAGIVMVQVAQRWEARERLLEELLSALIPPLAFSLPLAGVLAAVHIRRARRPLVELAKAVALRTPEQLSPIPVAGAPPETEPIVAALNRLMKRVSDSIEREQRFTSDAAHELRSPLAALHTDAELALAASGDRQRAALLRLREGTRRAARLVEQILTLARLDPLESVPSDGHVDLGACVQETLSRLAPAALARRIDLVLEEEGAAIVPGNAALLGIMVRNLVENAVRHVPDGGRIETRIESDPGGWRLRVGDSGPGIPREERERVMRPFHRRPGSPGVGSGLGLSIVARIAGLHGAVVDLRVSPLGGLEVCIRFPLTPGGDAGRSSPEERPEARSG